MSKPLTIKKHRSEYFKLRTRPQSKSVNVKNTTDSSNHDQIKSRYLNDQEVFNRNFKILQPNNTNAEGLVNVLKQGSNLTQQLKKRASYKAFRLRKSSCLRRPIFSPGKIQNLASEKMCIPLSQNLQKGPVTQFSLQNATKIGIQEIFYNQVKFIQICKQKQRNRSVGDRVSN